MGRVSRNESCPEDEINVVHCINRCVRRGFLCGDDPVTGVNYEHRREWIRHRFEFLAEHMAVEVLGFAILSNHFHIVLRNRPDSGNDWSDDEADAGFDELGALGWLLNLLTLAANGTDIQTGAQEFLKSMMTLNEERVYLARVERISMNEEETK